MARILVSSNGPMVPSGYGKQAKHLMLTLRDQGHKVACAAFYGLSGSPITWEGFTIFPSGILEFGIDVLVPHATLFRADLVITLQDFYKIIPIASDLEQAPFKLAAWIPLDCYPISWGDREAVKRSGATPIAISQFGVRQLQDAGYENPLYVPHSVDTSVYKPLSEEERREIREGCGIGDRFAVGICSANKDAIRKGWYETLAAFARFHRKHKDTVLMMHTLEYAPQGLKLRHALDDLEIPAQAVIWSDQYAQVAGLMGEDVMAGWYNSLDILSICSFAEAFGVPAIEAQACGIPIVATDCSALTELNPHGWKVKGTRFRNPIHRSWWVRPDEDAILKAYEKAYQEAGGQVAKMRKEESRGFAMGYDTQLVGNKYWKPTIDSLLAEDDDES